MSKENEALIQALQEEVQTFKTKTLFYQTALRFFPQQVWILDDEGVIISVSETLLRLLNQYAGSQGKDYVGENLYTIMKMSVMRTKVPKAVTEMVRRNDMFVRQREEAMVFEETVPFPEGLKTFISYKKRLLFGPKNRAYLLGMSIDITERRAVEDELYQMISNAENIRKSREKFVENFRHDIKTPVANIMSAADLLETIEDGEEKEFLISSIKTSSQQLGRYIEKMADVISKEEEKMPMDITDVDIREIASELKASLLLMAKTKGIALNISVGKTVPLLIPSNHMRLYRILANLMSNGLKYTKKGSVSLEINYAYIDESSGLLEVHVRDTGVGIEDKFQHMVFASTMRIRREEGFLEEGSGLGLGIVHDLVKELSGQIALSSEVGVGSCFTVTIPIFYS